jgi:hypothetical protein
VSLSVPNSSGNVKTLLKTPGAADPTSLSQIQLGPYGVYRGMGGKPRTSSSVLRIEHLQLK